VRKSSYPKLAVTLVIAGAFGLCACVGAGNDVPIRVKGAHPFKTAASGGGCEFDDTIFISGGSLDVSARTSYSVWFDVKNETQEIETSTNGEVIAGSSRNDFYVSRTNFRYTASNGLAFQAEPENRFSVIEPGGNGLKMGMDLIGLKASTQLPTSISAGAEPFELLVSFDLTGRFAHGGAEVTSNRVTFPITIFSSGFTGCPPLADGGVDRIAPTGPCGSGGGQDGPIGCCANPNFAPFCN
jgi:hypothetical protein